MGAFVSSAMSKGRHKTFKVIGRRQCSLFVLDANPAPMLGLMTRGAADLAGCQQSTCEVDLTKQKKDGLLGAIVRQAMKTGVLSGIPAAPALTAASAVAKYAATGNLANNQKRTAAPRPAANSNPPSRQPSPSAQSGRVEQTLAWLNRNPVVKDIAGDMARQAALAPGAARGLWHSAEDVGHLLSLNYGLTPQTFFMPGADLARRRTWAEAQIIAQKINDAIDNPSAAIESAKQGLNDWRASIDPSATPEGETTLEEIRRQIGIGLNQGELAYDVGSLFYGGAELKGLRGMRLLSAPPTAANYIARGVPKELADYFALPYTGRGHHYLPVRTRLPQILGGGPVPKALSESPFLLQKPRGITNGEFYKLHHAVDPYFYGGKVRKGYPVSRWSAKELKWKKYGKPGQLWHGAPLPLKMAVTSPAYVGAGVGANMLGDAEEIEGIYGVGRYLPSFEAP